jgi:hypothetical protein
MITFICRSIRQLPLLLAASLLWPGVAGAADAVVKSLQLHARLAVDHPDRAKLGDYPVLERYNVHNGLAPHEVDLVVAVYAPIGTSLDLEVFPVVGATGWAQTEGITNMKLLEETKTRLSAFQRLEKPVAGDTQVTFTKIDIQNIIDTYSSRHLWVRELIFRVCLQPTTDEQVLRNNVKELKLVLDPPD